MRQYQVLREVFRITMWKDDSIYRTVSQGHRWITPETERDNVPKTSGVLYAPPSSSYEGVTIRFAQQ